MYRGLDEAVAELRERMGGLPNPVEAGGIWTTIWFQEAHHSTAIEGNTLLLKQVEPARIGASVGEDESTPIAAEVVESERDVAEPSESIGSRTNVVVLPSALVHQSHARPIAATKLFIDSEVADQGNATYFVLDPRGAQHVTDRTESLWRSGTQPDVCVVVEPRKRGQRSAGWVATCVSEQLVLG